LTAPAPKEGRIVGIDFGDRRFGLAWSDPTRILAVPLRVVEGEAECVAELRRLAAGEAVSQYVLGLPLNMDGTVGPKARQVLAFKDRLEQAGISPVIPWDERLTTVQAEIALREGGMRGRRRAERVDKVAAQILLQSYLDRQRAES
jgi:putative Holliday junction resolvase